MSTRNAAVGYSALTDARDYLAALGAVMDRHMPNLDTGRCKEDRKVWPCPTMRDIAPALGIDPDEGGTQRPGVTR